MELNTLTLKTLCFDSLDINIVNQKLVCVSVNTATYHYRLILQGHRQRISWIFWLHCITFSVVTTNTEDYLLSITSPNHTGV